jgi:hypothetical protein
MNLAIISWERKREIREDKSQATNLYLIDSQERGDIAGDCTVDSTGVQDEIDSGRVFRPTGGQALD